MAVITAVEPVFDHWNRTLFAQLLRMSRSFKRSVVPSVLGSLLRRGPRQGPSAYRGAALPLAPHLQLLDVAGVHETANLGGLVQRRPVFPANYDLNRTNSCLEQHWQPYWGHYATADLVDQLRATLQGFDEFSAPLGLATDKAHEFSEIIEAVMGYGQI